MVEAVAAQRPRRWLRWQADVEKTIAVINKKEEDDGFGNVVAGEGAVVGGVGDCRGVGGRVRFDAAKVGTRERELERDWTSWRLSAGERCHAS